MNDVENYRGLVTAGELISFRVRIRESDLMIRADRDLSRPARAALSRYRREIEEYLCHHPEWGRSLSPVPAGQGAPRIVAAMSSAAAACGVGPMAAVAGALAWFAGEELSFSAGELIIENGGDIYLRSRRPRTVFVRIGEQSSFFGRIGVRIPARLSPLGVATSSGTDGRSLSWGRAAAATVLAGDAILADAAATALGNRIFSPVRPTVEAALETVAAIPGVIGCLVSGGNLLAARGEIELVDLDDSPSPRSARGLGLAGAGR